jgi:hypothetical protein
VLQLVAGGNTEARTKTAFASERAVAAFERAAQTEKEAAEDLKMAGIARQQAEVARKEAEGFQLQIAQANAQTAKLEKEAAAAKLDAEKLKQAVAWRIIPPNVAAVLEKALSAKPGALNLRYTDGDPEALFRAIQFSQILTKAKWRIAPGAVKFSNSIQFGLALPDSSGIDAATLRAAFSAARLEYSTAPLPPVGATFDVFTENRRGTHADGWLKDAHSHPIGAS